MIEIAVAIAREAGEILLRHQGRLDASRLARKSSPRDLVTEADLASERHVVARLRSEFPRDRIRSEEEVHEEGGTGRVWHVDPLDGTINFVHGLPIYTVSLALYEDGRPLLGVVHAPKLGETFASEAGRGATLDGTPIRVTSCTDLAEALLVTGFPYRRDELANDNLENWNRLFLRVRGLRRLGAASLDLAYVACGRFDAFWELHLAPHDVAAGALLVREAGGLVTDFSGGENWLEGGRIVASNGPLHEALRRSLRP